MKLKTKLFLWFGSLFVLFFLTTFIFENFLVNRNLSKTEKELYHQIYSLHMKKRENLENYLGIVIADLQANIDSYLYRTATIPFNQSTYLPTSESYLWKREANALFRHPWIDFIQVSTGGKRAYGITSSNVDENVVTKYEIDDDLAWLVADNGAYLGILVPSDLVKKVDKIELRKVKGLFYFAFDWKRFLALSPDNFKIDGGPFKKYYARMRKARSYLEAHRTVLESGNVKQLYIDLKKEFIRSTEKISPKEFLDSKTLSSKLIKEEFSEKFEDKLKRDRLVMVTSLISSMVNWGLWDGDPLNEYAPIGVVTLMPYHEKVSLIKLSKVYFKRPNFDASKYFKGLPRRKLPIAPSIAIFLDPSKKNLILGNTLYFSKNYLTVGMDVSSLMKKLSLASQQTSVLVHDRRVVEVSDFNGDNKSGSSFRDLPLDKMRKEMGEIQFGNSDYFYMHIQPYKEADLHFYLLQEKSRAFGLINKLRSDSKALVDNISLNMRIIACTGLIIALLFLTNIARETTKPITNLVKLALRVKEGKLDEIKLPEVQKGQSEEVATLVKSFNEMVVGLQEREKVRGVLNKVVSKEIAGEILKGQIHLGGEEREATVLFSDIRGFTKMTEKLEPAKVIELLNLCMTKITELIDLNGGVVDKYVGDEVMALFGAPVSHKDASLRSVVSAVRMHKRLAEWNMERKRHGEGPIEMGTGINSGLMVAGNMGEESRMNYTVLGSHVNLASRLCEAASPGEILISENVYNAYRVKDHIEVEEKEQISFKGFSEPVKIYRVLKLKSEDIRYDA